MDSERLAEADRTVFAAKIHVLEEEALARLAHQSGLTRAPLWPPSPVVQVVACDGVRLGRIRCEGGHSEHWTATAHTGAPPSGPYASAEAAAQALLDARAPIRAAGGAVWRWREGTVEVALVHRPRYDDWSLPRGKTASREPPVLAACREVAEQTGVRPIVGPRLPTRSYETVAGTEIVQYWAMRGNGTFRPTAEVDRVAWLPLPEAAVRLSHADDAGLLAELAAVPVWVDATVLLVRHAQAGDPARWKGDDELRPLDRRGLQQSETLRRVLPMFGPTRILSAGSQRCVDTVSLLAADIGISVEVDPSFSEPRFAHDRGPSLARLRALGQTAGTTVVCSQGTVVPDLVATVAAEDGFALGQPPHSKKASVWALFFSKARLVAANYYPKIGVTRP